LKNFEQSESFGRCFGGSGVPGGQRSSSTPGPDCALTNTTSVTKATNFNIFFVYCPIDISNKTEVIPRFVLLYKATQVNYQLILVNLIINGRELLSNANNLLLYIPQK
jgi:hypothetical protein